MNAKIIYFDLWWLLAVLLIYTQVYIESPFRGTGEISCGRHFVVYHLEVSIKVLVLCNVLVYKFHLHVCPKKYMYNNVAVGFEWTNETNYASMIYIPLILSSAINLHKFIKLYNMDSIEVLKTFYDVYLKKILYNGWKRSIILIK